MSMISKDDNYVLDLDLNVLYLDKNSKIGLLLPSKYNTYIDLTI